MKIKFVSSEIIIDDVTLIVNMINDYHLSIRRKDKQPYNPDWKTLQRISNKFFGCNSYSIEIFPAKDDIVDNNNCRHLWKIDKDKIPNLKHYAKILNKILNDEKE